MALSEFQKTGILCQKLTLRWFGRPWGDAAIGSCGEDYADHEVGDADVAGSVGVVVDGQPDPCPSGCRGSGGTCWTPPLGATRSLAPPVKI